MPQLMERLVFHFGFRVLVPHRAGPELSQVHVSKLALLPQVGHQFYGRLWLLQLRLTLRS